MSDKIKILAIESSCDETAAAVVEDGRCVKSNIISSQIELHKLYGGVVPEIASRKHVEKVNFVVREGIGLQAYGQRDPVVEYRLAGFEMFNDMTKAIQEETTGALFHVQVEQKIEREEAPKITGTNKDAEVEKKPYVRKGAKVGRNDPCPCGSAG